MEEEYRPLQQALVDLLQQNGTLTSPEVAQAFLSVPRHLFLPGEPVQRAYEDIAIQVRVGPDGRWTSSSSQPSIMAIMLEQLELRPGMRVLEIGAGTGYNAALMAYLVGPEGSVIAVDIQPDLVEDARDHLYAAGVENVLVVTGDGGYGWPDSAPYDRIILTASSATIAPAWREQLAEGGRLVLPLDLGGTQLSTAFEKRHTETGEELVSLSQHSCGFMSLQGGFALTPFWAELAPRLNLTCPRDPGLDLSVLVGADNQPGWLARPAAALPVGLRLSGDALWSGLMPWLAVYFPDRGCVLMSDEEALAEMEPSLPALETPLVSFSMGKVSSLAWLVLPAPDGAALLRRLARDSANDTFDLEVLVLGDGADTARGLVEAIHAWDAAGRPRTAQLRIRAVDASLGEPPTPGERLLPRPWTDFMIGYGG